MHLGKRFSIVIITGYPLTWRDRFAAFYRRNERLLSGAAFVGGFLFDMVAAREGVDHLLIVFQQVAYLVIVGAILYFEFIRELGSGFELSPRWERLWSYRGLLLHFCLGTLMNLYSMFFLMSASMFSSIVFVTLLLLVVILNEMHAVRRSGVDVKIVLYVVAVFCFFSLLVPLALHRIGPVPFGIAFAATIGVVLWFYSRLGRRIPRLILARRLLLPGLSIATVFLGLYLARLIPPVPLSLKRIGIYHEVTRSGDRYILRRERSGWQFWQAGDQRFAAAPGDRVYVFFAVFSPARFDDTVFVRWQRRDQRGGWEHADRIPIRITGGRKEGFRGFTSKENWSEGHWCVQVETRDGREIGRLYFKIRAAPADSTRVLTSEFY